MIKKNLLIYLFATLTLGGFFTSCSDDKDEPVVCPVEQTIFTDINGLALNYCGAPVLGKQIEFIPDASNPTKASVKISGSKFAIDGMPFELDGSGVIPGEETTTLNLDLNINGDLATFEGVDENAQRTISYKGSIHKSSLNLDLDVTYPKNILAGKMFDLKPYIPSFGSDPKSTPVICKWDSDYKFKVYPFGPTFSIEANIQWILGMTLMAAPIPGSSQGIYPPLLGSIKNIAFLPNGNVVAKYNEKWNDEKSPWKDSPLNAATYVMENDSTLRLFINPAQIAAASPKQASLKASRGNSVPQILMGLLDDVNVLLKSGIPFHVSVKENGETSVYLDETLLLPILKKVKPLFEDEAFVNGLIEQIKASTPDDYKKQVDGVLAPTLKAMPQIIDTTKSIQLGLNMAPVTAAEK